MWVDIDSVQLPVVDVFAERARLCCCFLRLICADNADNNGNATVDNAFHFIVVLINEGYNCGVNKSAPS